MEENGVQWDGLAGKQNIILMWVTTGTLLGSLLGYY